MKTASRIMLTFILLVFFTGISFSQVATNATPASTKSVVATPGKFVDANKNGICDNHEAKGSGAQGKNFIDANGDGKCDNCGTKCKGTMNCGPKGNGCANSCSKGKGKGNCCGGGQQHRYGCSSQAAPAADPKK